MYKYLVRLFRKLLLSLFEQDNYIYMITIITASRANLIRDNYPPIY